MTWDSVVRVINYPVDICQEAGSLAEANGRRVLLPPSGRGAQEVSENSKSWRDSDCDDLMIFDDFIYDISSCSIHICKQQKEFCQILPKASYVGFCDQGKRRSPVVCGKPQRKARWPASLAATSLPSFQYLGWTSWISALQRIMTLTENGCVANGGRYKYHWWKTK